MAVLFYSQSCFFVFYSVTRFLFDFAYGGEHKILQTVYYSQTLVCRCAFSAALFLLGTFTRYFFAKLKSQLVGSNRVKYFFKPCLRGLLYIALLIVCKTLSTEDVGSIPAKDINWLWLSDCLPDFIYLYDYSQKKKENEN